MSVVSDPISPIRPIGSDVTLTCTVELSTAVNVSVTINIQLTDPSWNVLTATTTYVFGLRHITTAIVSSFQRAQSGVYICTATVIPPSLFLNTVSQSAAVRVTTAKNH